MSSRVWNIISLFSLVVTVITSTALFMKYKADEVSAPKNGIIAAQAKDTTPDYAPAPKKKATTPKKFVAVLTPKQEKKLKKMWSGCNSLNAKTRIKSCKKLINSKLETGEALLLAYTNRASAYGEKEKYKQAVQDYDFILSHDRENFETLISRGDTHQILNRFDKAIDDYSAAISVNAQDYNVYLSRAWAYYQMDKVNAGIIDLDTAIKINKSNSELYATRGQFYETIGRNKDAAKNYRQSLKLNSRLVEARDGLKRTSRGNVAEAKAKTKKKKKR